MEPMIGPSLSASVQRKGDNEIRLCVRWSEIYYDRYFKPGRLERCAEQGDSDRAKSRVLVALFFGGKFLSTTLGGRGLPREGGSS